jgi:Helix-turn-helix domain
MTRKAQQQPPWVRALLDRSLSPAQFRVWIYLQWRQGGNGHSWPTQERMAGELGLTREGVRQITHKLESAGWLKSTWPDGPGRGHNKVYSVTTPDEKPNPRLPFEDKTPTAVGVLEGENPNRDPKKTPTEKATNTRKRTQPNNTSETCLRLATLLRDLILQRQPKNQACRANMRTWAGHVEKLIRINKRTPEEIERVIRWTQADTSPRGSRGFCWAPNIESTATLRKKFDRLEWDMKAANGGNGKRTLGGPPPAIRDANGLTEREKYLRGARA